MLQKINTKGELNQAQAVKLAKVENLDFELKRGNPNLIWGWKRNAGDNWRAVYFGGELGNVEDHAALTRGYLFYRTRATEAEIQDLHSELKEIVPPTGWPSALKTKQIGNGMAEVRFDMGHPSADDKDRVRRLQLRRPRKHLPQVVMPPALPVVSPAELGKFDIYIGSGLSYEAGLPTLCDMHDAFGVDTPDGTAFTAGSGDPLPSRLKSDLHETLKSFAAVHVGALSAELTPAMNRIAKLHREGKIGKVFTDNVDNMLSKAGIPFERTRGSGVFNEKYPAEFDSPTLVVVGVAADRRSLVKQARAKKLDVVTINPCEKVAPLVRHLDYIRPTDKFYQVSAQQFFA